MAQLAFSITLGEIGKSAHLHYGYSALITVRAIPNDIVNPFWGAERAEYRSGGALFASHRRRLMVSPGRGVEFP